MYTLLGQAVHSGSVELLPVYDAVSFQYPTLPDSNDSKFDLGTYIGVAGTKLRQEAAEEYLLRAKEYRVEIQACISSVNLLHRRVKSLAAAHEEERKMLEIIRQTYQTHSKDALRKSADLLRAIADTCLSEVSVYTNEKYEALLSQLKQMW